MFFVIDKSKIYSYVIAICTVVILFVAATGLNSINSKQNTTTTSSNVIDENTTNVIEEKTSNIIDGNTLKGNNIM